VAALRAPNRRLGDAGRVGPKTVSRITSRGARLWVRWCGEVRLELLPLPVEAV